MFVSEKMEASGVNGASKCDEELRVLLDAFGPAFSIDEIAAAYIKSGKNTDATAEALALSAADSSSDDGKSKTTSENASENNNPRRKNSRTKYRAVSLGSVSGFNGKEYVIKTTTSDNGARRQSKTDAPKAMVLPIPQSWADMAEMAESSCSSGDGMLHKDMEDFLFTMLGDGFKLEKDVIHGVLESCGYDIEKSMESLINLSTSPLDDGNKVISNSNNKSTGSCLISTASSEKDIDWTESYGDMSSNTSGVESARKEKERIDLQKEVLASLFSAPYIPEEPELPRRRIVRPTRGYAAYGNLVVEPPKETFAERKTPVVYQQHRTEKDADDEDAYQVLRKNVKEYRSTMKEYFQAAIEAFSKGDRVRADKLMEQGHFFQKKAREADEESSKLILKPRNSESEGDIVLDLHEGGAKEAVRLLKCHLLSFSGISSIKRLRVILDTSEANISKGSKGYRRRSEVLKLLEEESIKWLDGENAATVVIQMDSINRKKLSFTKKK